MSMWEKIKLGCKFLFGGFEAATDYLLNTVLNPYLNTDTVRANVRAAYEKTNIVLGYLREYREYCPGAWLTQYDATVDAVDAMVEVFADGQVSRLEIEAVVQAFNTARAAYMAE